jgi:hypothetical protein
VSEGKAVVFQNQRHQQLLALLSNTATVFFFWRIVFQNFVLEKKHENFVICYTDFSGFFGMKLIKLATPRSRQVLGRHL